MNQSQLNPEHLNASKGNQEHYRLERKISKISNFQTFKRSESSKLDEENNSILKIMEAASEDTNLYTEKFFTLETHLQREVLAYLLRKKSEFNKLINLSLKLKRSFRACRKFSEAVLLDQLIEAFLSETKDILDCDRAVIYMVDELNKEL